MRPVVVLGATGSIGRQTVEVATRLGYPIVALASSGPSPLLDQMADEHPSAVVRTAATDSQAAVEDLARIPGAIVVNGIVGSIGLGASVAALEAGNRLALANKESMIAGAEVVHGAASQGGGELIPVDSEHSALFQLLAHTTNEEVDRLVITASGGPFRGYTAGRLEDVSLSEALAHPTWVMGQRISIDSATLVNKGLEVIEAQALFGFDFDSIDVVVHPQSIVHSMVRLCDGSLLTHTGVTDMRIPIQYALTYPDRRPSPQSDLELSDLSLTFEAPDRLTFPALDLAYTAGRLGRWATAAYNAADEVAVAAFVAGRLRFPSIVRVIERVLGLVHSRPMNTIPEVLDADAEARRHAHAVIETGDLP